MSSMYQPMTEAISRLTAPNRKLQQQQLQNILAQVPLEDKYDPAIHYKGTLYHRDGYRMLKAAEVVELPEPLIPLMENYLQSFQQLGRDALVISQILHRILAKCKTAQEVRNAFPECLVPDVFLEEYPNRIKPAGYILEDVPDLHRQYLKYEDLIYQYAAMKLVVQ